MSHRRLSVFSMERRFLALIVALANVCVESAPSPSDIRRLPDLAPPPTVNCTVATCGELLFLTPYLKSNRFAEAKKAAQVSQLLPGLDSYSGYFTVDERYDSNMFFWFFPSPKNDRDVPVILWLAGGPGGASMVSVLEENGPVLADGLKLKVNPRNWAQDMNVLYIDNPVGAGFSFTRSSSGYTNDEEAVGRNLYSAVYQFFQLFPEYLKNDFFITGESAAGKFVPALAHTIHKNNPTASMKINLKGIAIGNGWVDPVNQLGYSEYLYNLGLIDIETQGEFAQIESHVRSLIQNKSYVEATSKLVEYLLGTAGGMLTSYWNATGIKSPFNYLDTENNVIGKIQVDVGNFFNAPEVRKGIHAGDQPFFWANVTVLNDFYDDMGRSIVPWLEVLMDHYRVLIYNGQLDVTCPYPLTINYVRKLKWGGAEEYLRAKRHQWHVGGELAGYAKSARNFTEVLVRDAGHGVTQDQPLWARDMIQRFTKDLPFGTST